MAKAEVVVVDILINGYLAVKGPPSISKQSKKVHFISSYICNYKYLVYTINRNGSSNGLCWDKQNPLIGYWQYTRAGLTGCTHKLHSQHTSFYTYDHLLTNKLVMRVTWYS